MHAGNSTLSLPRYQLWIEFFGLYLGIPLMMFAWFGHYSLLAVVWSLAIMAVILLWRTPGFRLASLSRGPVLGEWRLILGFALLSAAITAIFVFTLVPERFLSLPRERFGVWLIIMAAYPILSALPQEIIYRSLFFERYGQLFTSPAQAIAVNGIAFALGHLFFMNPVTLLMTGFGGAIMGWAYLRNRSMGLAWVLHCLAGQIIFTLGLGRFFYHGAVGGG